MRLAGAAITMSIFTVAASLGFWDIVGVPIWLLRLVALIAGALLAPTLLGSWLWLLLGALTTFSAIVSFTPIVRPIAQRFVRDDRSAPGHATADPVLDAVIVLSGEVSDEGRVTGSTMERLISGVQNARTMKITAMALSATAPAFGDDKPSSEPDQRALVSLMAPELQLQFVHNVFSTRDEAVAFTALAKARGWHRVLLVTSPMHSRRACATFEKLGLAVECRPAVPRSHDPSRLESSESRRLVFQDVLYELSATLLYRSRGWN